MRYIFPGGELDHVGMSLANLQVHGFEVQVFPATAPHELQLCVIEADNSDPSVQGVRQLNAMLATEKRVSATTLQTVGAKGYDGFTLAVVN